TAAMGTRGDDILSPKKALVDRAMMIDLAYDNGCAVSLEGEISCWGDNTLGQLGIRTSGGGEPTPRPVTRPSRVLKTETGRKTPRFGPENHAAGEYPVERDVGRSRDHIDGGLPTRGSPYRKHDGRGKDIAMAWFILVVAGLLEVVWASLLPATRGFTRLWPSVGFLAALTASMVLLSLAVRDIPVGTAYA